VLGFGLLVGALVLLLAPDTWHLTPAFAQQPQAQQGQPLSALNAKYVNGVAPGYWPTAGTANNLNLSAGTVLCGSPPAPVNYAGGTLSMAASVTNYVYLDTSSSCAPASNTTGFTFTTIPIAVVAMTGSTISSITDVRTWFTSLPSASLAQPGLARADLMSGADFSAKVNACIAAVNAAGGGTCDARGLGPTNSASQTVTVGDGTHQVTLLLPAGTIVFAAGKQLIYRSFSSVIGQGFNGLYNWISQAPGSGSIISCTPSATVPCVMNYNESGSAFNSLIGAHLENFSIQGTLGSTPTANSVGLMVGGNSSNVENSVVQDVRISGFDVGTSIAGPGGNTAYNTFRNVFSEGASYGVHVQNGSGYTTGVNSNSWYNGSFGGAVGLYDSGSNADHYYGVDLENNSTRALDLEGINTLVVAPYEEAAGGADILNGWQDYVIGPILSTGSYYSPSTLCATCYILGPNSAPATMGVSSGIIFGDKFQYDDGYNNSTKLLANGTQPWLDLTFSGAMASIYGYYGHSGFKVGDLITTSGISESGSLAISQLSTPAPPTLTATGGTGTNYTYFNVCHDANGGSTLPSSGATVSGPATLSGSAYITIVPPAQDGCYSWDILKTNTSTSLYTGAQRTYGGSSMTDHGQSTAAYTAPTRNSTGDASLPGNLKVSGNIVNPVISQYTVSTLPTPGTYMEAWVTDGITPWDTTTGGGAYKVRAYYNGSAWAPEGPGQPYDVAMFYPGVPGGGQLLARVTMTRAVVFPANLTGSQGSSGEPATGSTVINIERNSVTFGTCTFGIGASTCTFASANGATFAAGDVLSAVGPGMPDATLGDIAITIVGSR
jgi:hypothetical protein